jgi:hypothetical protein
LPEPAKGADGDQSSTGGKWEELTFAVDPQEGATRLPFGEDTALKEPLGCSTMVNVACNVVIG